MTFLRAKPFIVGELITLTVLIPAAIYHFHLIRYMLPTLWLIAIYCLVMLRHTTGERWRDLWQGGQVTRAAVKPILTRFALCAVFIGVATWLLAPDRLFSFVLERPAFWALVMVLYPILSVIPQEIIFRSFFFRRYKTIFTTPELMVIASGLSFGLAHVIFQNWVAPLLCAVGGILFSMTYRKRPSLALVSLEHALFGDFIFTVGLGFYFYHGSVAAIQAVAQ